MKTDAVIKENVLDELQWQPNVDETEIGVTVDRGVVTLTGTVDRYTKKIAAEEAAKKVKGVKAVVENIEVKYGIEYKKTDKEIAKAALEALKWNSSVPDDKITLKVENGWIHLNGEVEWEYQRDAAKRTVQNLLGVRAVTNNITLKQTVKPTGIKEKISKAFERLADVDANNIEVIVEDHTVKLKGKVHSLAEKEEANKSALYTPGVYHVENELLVEDF